MQFPTITFLGAARTVTGSCHLISSGPHQILVDCGMFQGSKTLRELNYGNFAFDPAAIDAVLLTHAHIDHSGLVPKLVRRGYRGPIFASPETCDLLSYMLPDSAAIQEAEVERLNRRRTRRGEAEVRPIYTRDDAEQALRRLQPIEPGELRRIVPEIEARFWPAAHILGAMSIELRLPPRQSSPIAALFSGDLGPNAPSLAGPAGGVDYLVIETTYGGRDGVRLTDEQRQALLADAIRDAMRRGGNLLIPAFAVERTQSLLYDIAELFASSALPPTRVFIDSPLATRATEVFSRHVPVSETRPDLRRHPWFHFVETAEQSKQLNVIRSGAIILAGSGMCEAGRIRHHLRNNLWRSGSTVLFVGYQAPGTLGQLIRSGARTVRIMGEEVKVDAKIVAIETYSAHADQSELLDWVAARQPVRRAIILTHGEPAGMSAFRKALGNRLGGVVPILEPELGAKLVLDGTATPSLEVAAPLLADPRLASADWHNSYASLLLALSEHLRGAKDDATREAILARMRADLEAELGATRYRPR